MGVECTIEKFTNQEVMNFTVCVEFQHWILAALIHL